MEFLVKGLSSGYEIEHLTRIFYPDAAVRQAGGTKGDLVYAAVSPRRMAAALRVNGRCRVRLAPPPKAGAEKLALSRLVYDLLREETGYRPPWGMLTGVRPVHLMHKSLAAGGEAFARQRMAADYDVSEEKYSLARDIAERQQPMLAASEANSYSLYVSVPFCPTRCAYCSFVSRTIQREAHLIDPYLGKLEQELAGIAAVAHDCGLKLETLYIGGGTPTALALPQLEKLLAAVETHFDTAAAREYTVEAGRPDCTDFDKLALLKAHGVTRISINPQTMQDEVLAAIGRRHTAEDILRCYGDARRAGHDNINMDLIAGLPGDTAEGFAATLDTLLALAPENITVHTLTLKRASDMVIDNRREVSLPAQMLATAYPKLKHAGYAPYYLYRQKNTVEHLENTGWAKPGTEGLYNVYIMEETHTILAAGAGGTTKLVGGAGTKIKRLFNHKFPADYIAGFDELLARKEGVEQFYARNLDSQTTG